jgi:hypothetical protein
MTRPDLAADQSAVRRACVGSWTRESAIIAAMGPGRGRVRRAFMLALLARHLESKTVWLAHGNTPVRAWRVL